MLLSRAVQRPVPGRQLAPCGLPEQVAVGEGEGEDGAGEEEADAAERGSGADILLGEVAGAPRIGILVEEVEGGVAPNRGQRGTTEVRRLVRREEVTPDP